ncbi:zinc-binding oxidoreductase-like protein ToxD [Stipitochalara longipes BDJ]|nr:zinc-binding oxidoreductase-like protein ToxD [Stipitochalara longipes BDJ]
MKEAIVHPGTRVKIIDSEIPQPNANQVLIKIIFSGCNPKDWKRPEWFQKAHNSGDDISGIVEAVGAEVTEFRPGDRVAALHEMMAPGGSYAEYGLAWDFATFHLPKNISFGEGATIPLAAMTAALGLYQRLGLPPPWAPATEKLPLLIYGGAGAVGSYAIKFAQASNIHPLIVVAGNSMQYVESLISREKGDTIIDYRLGEQGFVRGVQKALSDAGVSEVGYAYDAITGHNSFQNISEVLAKKSKLCLVLPNLDFSSIPNSIETFQSAVASIFQIPKHGEKNLDQDFGFVYFRWFGKALKEGVLTGHPFEIVPGGLQSVGKGLNDLKTGKNKASKYVFEITKSSPS